jgi:hypothetical protein
VIVASPDSSPEWKAAASIINPTQEGIQNAVNKIANSATKIGQVLVAPGNYTFRRGVQLRTGITVSGPNDNPYGAVIKCIQNSDLGCFYPAANDTHAYGVSNLYLNGNYAAGGTCTGIYLSDVTWSSTLYDGFPTTSPDPLPHFSNLRIIGFGGTTTRDGIYGGNSVRQVHLRNIVVFDPGRYGLNWNCVDSHLSDIHVGSAGVSAFYVDGSNNRFHGCKGYFSDEVGFHFTGGRNSLAACETQDNGTHGFYLESAGGGGQNTLAGCVADSNGRLGTGYGFFIEASRTTAEACYAFDKKETGTSVQDVGFYISGTDNTVSGFAYQMDAAGQYGCRLTASHNTVSMRTEDCDTGIRIANSLVGLMLTGASRLSGTDDLVLDGALPTNSFVRYWENGTSTLHTVG